MALEFTTGAPPEVLSSTPSPMPSALWRCHKRLTLLPLAWLEALGPESFPFSSLPFLARCGCPRSLLSPREGGRGSPPRAWDCRPLLAVRFREHGPPPSPVSASREGPGDLSSPCPLWYEGASPSPSPLLAFPCPLAFAPDLAVPPGLLGLLETPPFLCVTVLSVPLRTHSDRAAASPLLHGGWPHSTLPPTFFPQHPQVVLPWDCCPASCPSLHPFHPPPFC